MNRREFLTSIAASSGVVMASSSSQSFAAMNQYQHANSISPSGIRLEELTLYYRELPSTLDGYTVSFIADIHLGGWMKDAMVIEALDLAASKNSSALFLGGDLIWVPDGHARFSDSFFNPKYTKGKDEDLAQLVFSELARMIKPYSYTDGIYTVLGNHDRWSSYTAYEILSQESQIKTLKNSAISIPKGNARLQVFGTEDLWTGIPSLPNFTGDKNEFSILLTHNPDFASFAYHRAHIPFNLSLSGHTHAGQIKLPLIGALAYNIEDNRYAEGLVDYGATKFYTTRGVGWVELPFRMNCPSEVTIITLRAG